MSDTYTCPRQGCSWTASSERGLQAHIDIRHGALAEGEEERVEVVATPLCAGFDPATRQQIKDEVKRRLAKMQGEAIEPSLQQQIASLEARLQTQRDQILALCERIEVLEARTPGQVFPYDIQPLPGTTGTTNDITLTTSGHTHTAPVPELRSISYAEVYERFGLPVKEES